MVQEVFRWGKDNRKPGAAQGKGRPMNIQRLPASTHEDIKLLLSHVALDVPLRVHAQPCYMDAPWIPENYELHKVDMFGEKVSYKFRIACHRDSLKVSVVKRTIYASFLPGHSFEEKITKAGYECTSWSALQQFHTWYRACVEAWELREQKNKPYKIKEV